MRTAFRRRRRLALVALAGLLWAAPPGAVTAEEALVAVASNFAAAAERLRGEFERTSGHRLTFSAGSTGKLYAKRFTKCSGTRPQIDTDIPYSAR